MIHFDRKEWELYGLIFKYELGPEAYSCENHTVHKVSHISLYKHIAYLGEFTVYISI